MTEELRRKPRVKVCCRAVVRDRYGVWMGVTDDIGESGCRIISPRMLRTGSWVSVTLSSDLFPEELEVLGEAAWTTSECLAIKFATAAGGRLSPAQFLEKVLEHGTVGPRARVIPVVRGRTSAPTRLAHVDPSRSVVLVNSVANPAEHVPFRIPASRA